MRNRVSSREAFFVGEASHGFEIFIFGRFEFVSGYGPAVTVVFDLGEFLVCVVEGFEFFGHRFLLSTNSITIITDNFPLGKLVCFRSVVPVLYEFSF